MRHQPVFVEVVARWDEFREWYARETQTAEWCVVVSARPAFARESQELVDDVVDSLDRKRMQTAEDVIAKHGKRAYATFLTVVWRWKYFQTSS
jgi:hypothetical protein